MGSFCPNPGEAESIGRATVIEGSSANALAGAVLVTTGWPVYIKGLPAWNEDTLHKIIIARGQLKKEYHIPGVTGGAELRQGAEDEQFVLEQATWQLK